MKSCFLGRIPVIADLFEAEGRAGHLKALLTSATIMHRRHCKIQKNTLELHGV